MIHANVNSANPEGHCPGDGQDELEGTCLEEKDDESYDDEGDYE